jgi:hypothetical protein
MSAIFKVQQGLNLIVASTNKYKTGSSSRVLERLLLEIVFEHYLQLIFSGVTVNTTIQPEQPHASVDFALGFLYKYGILKREYGDYFLEPHVAAIQRTSDSRQSSNTLERSMQRLFKTVIETYQSGPKIFLGLENGVTFRVLLEEELDYYFKSDQDLISRYTCRINVSESIVVWICCIDICYANLIPQSGTLNSAQMFNASSFGTFFPMFAAIEAANRGFVEFTVGSQLEMMVNKQLEEIQSADLNNREYQNIWSDRYGNEECLKMVLEINERSLGPINGKNPHLHIHSFYKGELAFGVDRITQIEEPLEEVLLGYLGKYQPSVLRQDAKDRYNEMVEKSLIQQ